MSLANKLDNFIKNTKQSVFIEAEGTPEVIRNFIDDYNSKYIPKINNLTDGIIQLHENANKWGLELRLYLKTKDGAPDEIKITRNTVYRDNYSYRINDVKIIRKLFDLGYRIGLN